MKKLILSLLAITALSACSAEYQERVRKENFEFDAKKCESYGAKRGSDSFIQCMATLEAARRTSIMVDRPLPQPIVSTIMVPK